MSNHAFTLLAPESWKSASSQNGSQTVSNGVIWSDQALTPLALESWKSASSQNVSQTVSNGLIGSQNVKSCF